MTYHDRQGNSITREAWVAAMKDNRVALDQVGPYQVSTVWLGIDHGFGHGAPLIFETMVFGGGGRTDLTERFSNRYTTEAAAIQGHANIVGMVQALEGATP